MALRAIQQTSIIPSLYMSCGQCGIGHRMRYHPDTRLRLGTSEIATAPALGAACRPYVAAALRGSSRPHPCGLPARDPAAEAGPDPMFDADQFRQGLLRLVPDLRRSAGTLIQGAEQVDALVQETLIRAWLGQDQYRPRSDLQSWTLAIMRSCLSLSQRETSDELGVIDVATGPQPIDSEWPASKSRSQEE